MTSLAHFRKICIFGAGSWGTALATVAAVHAKRVCIWGRDTNVVNEICTKHFNSKYLKGIPLAKNISATLSVDEALSESELVVNAIPTQNISEFYSEIKNLISSDIPIVNTSKGICTKTLQLPVQLLKSALQRKDHDQFFVLAGPSFAKETAEGQATAVTLAGPTQKSAERVGKAFFTPTFRTYPSTDIVGIELAGAAKNVIAIASGVAEGLGLGFNTQSALITRGLAEISRLGKEYGADPITFLGLAGMGDLVLTCTGNLSRNRSLGKFVAQGKTLDEARALLGQVAEGVFTAQSLHAIASKKKIEMPIAGEVYNILFKNKSARKALSDLMTRPMRPEKS